MPEFKEASIEMMREIPWWVHSAGYAVLLTTIYLVYSTAPQLGVLLLGGTAILLWYASNTFYGYASALYNERSLLRLLNKLGGTFEDNDGLIDTPKEDEHENTKRD